MGGLGSVHLLFFAQKKFVQVLHAPSFIMPLCRRTTPSGWYTLFWESRIGPWRTGWLWNVFEFTYIFIRILSSNGFFSLLYYQVAIASARWKNWPELWLNFASQWTRNWNASHEGLLTSRFDFLLEVVWGLTIHSLLQVLYLKNYLYIVGYRTVPFGHLFSSTLAFVTFRRMDVEYC